MKEESAYVSNALRTALRIYNMRRAADPGALKTTRPAVVRKTAEKGTRTVIHASQLGPPNTHYSVVLRCLHRHLEQSRTGCLLSEQRQPCPPDEPGVSASWH